MSFKLLFFVIPIKRYAHFSFLTKKFYLGLITRKNLPSKDNSLFLPRLFRVLFYDSKSHAKQFLPLHYYTKPLSLKSVVFSDFKPLGFQPLAT